MPFNRLFSRARLLPVAAAVALLLAVTGWRAGAADGAAAPAAPASAAAAVRPALTVTTTTLQTGQWPQKLAATGSVAAWQEAVVSAEGAGGRLVAVYAQVGERVKRGQLLAQLATDTVQADIDQSRAGLAEAQAVLAEASANAQRARELQPSGAISMQQAQQAITAANTAQARLDALRARLKADELRLAQTRVLAPDDGLIAQAQAVIGSFAGTGQELFRLIRRERLEWRAEVSAADLARLQTGQAVQLTTPNGHSAKGTVRQVAPTVNPQNRMGLVYVDLAPGSELRAGMFARGEFSFGHSPGATLPRSAVLQRDGFAMVLRLDAEQRVRFTKVSLGRRIGDRVEVTAGLPADAQVVVSGGAFLAEGDKVAVVAAPPPQAAAPAAAAASVKP